MQCVRDQMGPYMAAIPDAKITNAGNSFFLLMIQSRNTNPISHLTYNQINSFPSLRTIKLGSNAMLTGTKIGFSSKT